MKRLTTIALVFLAGCRSCEQQAAPVDAGAPVVDASIKPAVIDAGARPLGPVATLDAYCIQHADGCVVADLPDPDMKTVKVTDDEYVTTWLALRTAAGWWPQSLRLAQDERKTGFTNPTVTIETLRVERPEHGLPFVLVQRSWYQQSMLVDPEKHTPTMVLEAGRDVRACRFDGGYPDCTEKHVLADIHGDPKQLAWDAGTPTIAPTKKVTVDADGKLVVD